MKNKYNVQVVLGNKLNYNYIDQIEKYNTHFNYVIRRTKIENGLLTKYGILLTFPLISQKK